MASAFSDSSSSIADPGHPRSPFPTFRAFHIVKRFISLGTNDTVEALQAFTSTRIPSQPWATVVPAVIPLASCDRAAQVLVEYFGPQDLRNVVGGEKWWQVREAAGIDAEWVAMTSDWKKAKIVETMPDGEARMRAAKEAKFNKRHERARNDKHTAAAAASPSQHHAGDNAGQGGYDAEAEREDELDEEAAAEAIAAEDSQGAAGTEDDAVPIEELDRLRRVLLYIHGGGYYFGSINTHRYQIVRLARKMGGRAFCPNYRKAPGYPWPCPLQDCLAAYFYLTDPPPGAKHKAVDPKNIVLAGDSAGGGMCLAVLGVLRDLGLPMPAGAVLISPWCDMTHSFPSILQNTDTDIIPPYGFVHKPSTLWPVPANASPQDQPTRNVPHGIDADAPEDAATHTADVASSADPSSRKDGPQDPSGQGGHDAYTHADGQPQPQRSPYPHVPDPLQSEAIRVQVSDPSGDPIELKQQIQLYATNDQLFHPLCSPVLQGSLGGLPPLYILAGDGEVLRDEVLMLAHRAARPAKYTLPEHLLAKNARAREAAERFNGQPTQVHLQVFDYQCHVLTLFSFTTAARYAYRAIASFCKYVTHANTEYKLSSEGNGRSAFPPLGEEPSTGSSVFSPQVEDASEGQGAKSCIPPIDTTLTGRVTAANGLVDSPSLLSPPSSNRGGHSPSSATRGPSTPASADSHAGGTPAAESSAAPSITGAQPLSEFATRSSTRTTATATTNASTTGGAYPRSRAGSKAGENAGPASSWSGSRLPKQEAKARQETLLAEKRQKVKMGVENDYSGQVPLIRPEYREHMIRERVDVRGAVRPLEDEGDLQAIRLYLDHPDQVGIIKEGPVRRYLEGQGIWDKRFKRTAKKVEKKREKNEEKARALLERASELGLLARNGHPAASHHHRLPDHLDVCASGETPPPSAVAGRRDCDDAITLLRTSLHHRAEAAGVTWASQGGSSSRLASNLPSGFSSFSARKKRDLRRLDEELLGLSGRSRSMRQAGRQDGVGRDAGSVADDSQLPPSGTPTSADANTATTPSAAETEGERHSRSGDRAQEGLEASRGDAGTVAGAADKKGQRMHGLNLWVRSMGMFGKKTREKAFFADESTTASSSQ